MKEIELPNGSIVEFPDNMSNEEIQKVLKEHSADILLGFEELPSIGIPSILPKAEKGVNIGLPSMLPFKMEGPGIGLPDMPLPTIPRPSLKYKKTYNELYKKWGEKVGLDWRLLKAVAIIESSENPTSIGDEGKSFGLFQLVLPVASAYGIIKKEDLLNPEKNIQVGALFLKDMINKYGTEEGIQAYNLGEKKYLKKLRSPDYLKKVMERYKKLQKEY